MKNIFITVSIAIMILLTAGCTSNTSTPLSKLCDVYAEIAENNQEMTNAYQEVYAAPRDKQKALVEKAKSIAENTQSKNQELAEKAKNLGVELQGSDIPCEIDASLGYKVDKLEFSMVNATDNLCSIMLKGDVTGGQKGTVYALMLNKDGDVLDRVMGTLAEDAVRINFRITTNKGPQVARAYGAVTSIKIVTETEYKTGKADDSASDKSSSNDYIYENEGNPDPEAAYVGGNESDSAESVTVNGIVIKKGALLAETLREFNPITWDYNADFGVTATVGNVWITIDESDLTQKGQDIINAIPSDMENNITFSIDYIKPTAKINKFEAE